jgi:hypothetical protein
MHASILAQRRVALARLGLADRATALAPPVRRGTRARRRAGPVRAKTEVGEQRPRGREPSPGAPTGKDHLIKVQRYGRRTDELLPAHCTHQHTAHTCTPAHCTHLHTLHTLAHTCTHQHTAHCALPSPYTHLHPPPPSPPHPSRSRVVILYSPRPLYCRNQQFMVCYRAYVSCRGA